MFAHHHLCFANLQRSKKSAEVADTTSGERELSDKVSVIREAPASFKSDVKKL